jgi:hypothetical protein
MEQKMLKKIWKWILAIASVALFFILGRKLFPESQDEKAWNDYLDQKKKFEDEKTTLDQENEADQIRLDEIDKEVEDIDRKLLKRTVQTREEIKRIDKMSAKEVANATIEKKRRLAKRLGYDV